MRRLLLALMLALVPNAVWAACANTVSVKDGAGSTQTFCRGTDGGTNFIGAYNIIDSTGVNFLGVNGSGQMAIQAPPSLPLPTGAATDATLAKLNVGQGTALGTNTGPMMQGSVTTAAPTYTTGQISPLSLSTAGALRVDNSGVTQPVSGTVSVNALPTGSNIIGKVGIDQTTDVTTNGVEIAPTAASAAGIAPTVSAAAEASHVLKAGAGNLYTLTTAIGGTTGYIMLFDATSAPVDGAVTPKWCKPVLSNGTLGGDTEQWGPGPPMAFSTGITVVFSSTGCFTKTASATATFSAQVK